jgi:hypothetical protein
MMTLASPFWVVQRSVAFGAAVLALAGPADANDNEAALFEAAKKQPPMEFFVARGGPDACGVGCDRWIAAEGRIVRDTVGPDGRPEGGTTARLMSLLGQLGGRKLPIFFYSQGGDILESLSLGPRFAGMGIDGRRGDDPAGEMPGERCGGLPEVDARASRSGGETLE